MEAACKFPLIRMDVWAAILPSGVLSLLKSFWMIHEVSTSYSDCFSPRGRPWKSRLQSLVLSVILSAWMCALKSIMCSTAIESFQLETGSMLWNSGLKVLCTWMDCVSIYLINLSNTMTQRPVNLKSLQCQNDHKKEVDFFKLQIALKIWKVQKRTLSF